MLLSLVFFLVMIPQSFLDILNIVELCWFYFYVKTCSLCYADGTGMVGRIMFAWIQG